MSSLNESNYTVYALPPGFSHGAGFATDFWDEFTEHQPGACLNPDDWTPNTGYGDPLTFVLRIGIAAVILLKFVRWQRAHAEDPGVPPHIADLETEPPRVPCVLFAAMNPNIRFLGISCPLPLMPDRPCEYLHTGMWQSFIFTWAYAPRFFEPTMSATGRETVTLLRFTIQLLIFMILGKASTSVTNVIEGGLSLTTLLALASIYAVSIVGVVAHELFMVIFGMAHQRRGMVATVVYGTTGILLSSVVVGMTSALVRHTCPFMKPQRLNF